MIAASYASPPAFLPFRRCHFRRPSNLPPSLLLNTHPTLHTISSSLFNRRRRRASDPKYSTDRNLELTIDADAIVGQASAAAARLLRVSEENIRRFLSTGGEAFNDLRTSVRVDRAGNRIVFSCRESSLLFVANLFLWTFAAILAARVLVWMGQGFRSRWRFRNWALIRRDRSLGGREVVVGRRLRNDVRNNSFGVSVNPLSPARRNETTKAEKVVKTWRRKQEQLPKWWPEAIPPPVISTGKHDYQREVDKLVQAIMDYRMCGKDYRYDDIIQLREICKVSGAKASFETENSRDSFYRASIDLVLNLCSRALVPSEKVQIGEEDVREFIAGLADNIGLSNFRAATLVSAAVAARTRSCFLQSWALEVQGKESEALEELLKICLIHRAFPPEENSAEMEMVGSSLKRHLNVGQRRHLLSLYKETCVGDSHRSIVEALSLEQ